MKKSFSFVVFGVSFFISGSCYSQVVEFNRLASTVLRAPLPVSPNGFSYKLPSYCHTSTKPWSAVPSIRFDADDDKGTTPTCSRKYPKHLGTDYVAPAGTAVYAIADGVIKRSGYFTTDERQQLIGDAYIVVESGSSDRWTTTYGHLTYRSVSSGSVKKGDIIGYLFNFRYAGDVPHLHLAIHKGKYDGTSAAVRGFSCGTDSGYLSNRYGFVSPELMKYETFYY